MVETKNAYSIRQFAEKAEVSKEAVRKAIDAGTIKAELFDTMWIIPKSELENFVSKKRSYPKQISRKK